MGGTDCNLEGGNPYLSAHYYTTRDATHTHTTSTVYTPNLRMVGVLAVAVR
jgi:hypothetical protein